MDHFTVPKNITLITITAIGASEGDSYALIPLRPGGCGAKDLFTGIDASPFNDGIDGKGNTGSGGKGEYGGRGGTCGSGGAGIFSN